MHSSRLNKIHKEIICSIIPEPDPGHGREPRPSATNSASTLRRPSQHHRPPISCQDFDLINWCPYGSSG
ncbi:hypothetical protein J5N97_009689 [Dioscorea zingiberensis]|uniref:Uncharacterized protein n=1 Tax=Dioscorea zingiberensis TaxID=325984 RepID=A0A9D5CYP3_9LILI|nr:hypothetical protein J5N97_009689 [Dioscorea zingiberensis]